MRNEEPPGAAAVSVIPPPHGADDDSCTGIDEIHNADESLRRGIRKAVEEAMIRGVCESAIWDALLDMADSLMEDVPSNSKKGVAIDLTLLGLELETD